MSEISKTSEGKKYSKIPNPDHQQTCMKYAIEIKHSLWGVFQSIKNDKSLNSGIQCDQHNEYLSFELSKTLLYIDDLCIQISQIDQDSLNDNSKLREVYDLFARTDSFGKKKYKKFDNKILFKKTEYSERHEYQRALKVLELDAQNDKEAIIALFYSTISVSILSQYLSIFNMYFEENLKFLKNDTIATAKKALRILSDFLNKYKKIINARN